MLPGARFWRWLSGAAILGLLVAFGVLLTPHYVRNLQFKRALEQLSLQSENLESSDELLRVRVMDQAARLGLSIRPEAVRLRRSAETLSIEVRYVVPVELALYTVGLHFHPKAGGRQDPQPASHNP